MRKASHRPAKSTPREWNGDSLNHWVKHAFMAMRREMEASLRTKGMTVTQWRAVGVLLHTPGSTHSDLVQRLEIEAPSVTSLVNGMERKGWVKRTRSTADARVKRLSLTPHGRRLIEAASEAMGPVEQRMAAQLSASDQETLKKLLRAMVEGMQKSS